MRSLFIVALATISITVTASAQTDDGKKIDDLAKHIITSLKKLDTSDVNSFRKILISEKEIYAFIEAMDKDEEEKAEIRENIKEGNYEEEVYRVFGYLIQETRRSGINWSKIEFEDMLYKLKLRDGLKQLEGEIYFKEGDAHYEMGIMAGKLNDKYVLIELRSLRDPRWRREYEDYDEAAAEAEAEEMTREMELALEEAMEEAMREASDEEDYEAEQELIKRMEEMEKYEGREEMYEPIPPVDGTQMIEEKRVIQYEEVIEEEPRVQAEIIDFPDIEASYPGGNTAMMKFIAENVVYPKEAIEKGIQGRVFTQAVVLEDGTLTDIKVMRGVSPEIDAEAVRVISMMPKWIPGEVNGKKAKMMVRIPITFQLN